MAVNTILLDFSVDPSLTKTDPSLSVLAGNIEEVLRDFLADLRVVNNINLDGSLVKIYTADGGALVNLRIFTNGLIIVNIDYYKGDKDDPLLSFDTCHQLEKHVREKVVGVKRTQTIPGVKRGTFIRYFPSSDIELYHKLFSLFKKDERLLEYDIDKLVFEENTPYQKVLIVHSKSLGNMLILDDLQNLAESDLIYTETLMQRGKENYEGKEILILGGGDGALLYELLKEKPKEVIMLEIDEVVMKACAKYMRSVCGDVLDQYEGPHYKIIVGDCMKALKQYLQDGRKFDYIFGDLTDVPLSEDHSQELWAFINKVLDMSFKVLKPDGKFMTHLTGTASSEAIELYKQQLEKINPPVTYTTDTAFVPSFLEEWVFCQVKFAKQPANKE